MIFLFKTSNFMSLKLKYGKIAWEIASIGSISSIQKPLFFQKCN